QDGNGMTDFGMQLGLHPAEGYDLYANFLLSDLAGTTFDLVGSLTFTPSWTTGINFAHHRNGETVTDYSGVALYQVWKLNDHLDLGLRGEWFKYFNTGSESNPGGSDGPRVFGMTASGNIHLGPLVLIPEWRID